MEKLADIARRLSSKFMASRRHDNAIQSNSTRKTCTGDDTLALCLRSIEIIENPCNGKETLQYISVKDALGSVEAIEAQSGFECTLATRLSETANGPVLSGAAIDPPVLSNRTNRSFQHMYVPPFDSLLRALGTDRVKFERAITVPVPREALKLLLQLALESSDFNQDGYLKDNPDIAKAVRDGDVEDAYAHYVGFGYFEGRTGGTPNVDERWYLTTYSDVAQAVKLGSVKSASEHYNVIGGSEGRSPSVEYIPIAEQWKKALATKRAV